MYGEVNLPTERGTKNKPAMPIPVRDLKATANLVDLTERYNASLAETWQPMTGLLDLEVNLSSLATGVTNLAGVQFDVRGLIRLGWNVLNGSVFPAAVEIPVGRQFRQLHVLHGATTTTMDGTHVGTYRLHYRDGGTNDLSILYGRDVLDWEASAPARKRAALAPTAAAELAWIGPVDRLSPGVFPVRLFKRTYENPAPDREVVRITFESTLTATGPFLVAMTVE